MSDKHTHLVDISKKDVAFPVRESDAFLSVIETHQICPWSKPARKAGEVERYFFGWSEFFRGEYQDKLASIVEKVGQNESTVVALLIFPKLNYAPRQWEDAVKRFRKEHLEADDRERVLACAAFHPELTYSARTPATLVKLFRRSPHPTIQLVRLSVLRELSKGTQGQDMYMSYEDALKLIESNAPPPRESPSQQVTRQNFERFGQNPEEIQRELDGCRRK